MKPKATQPQCLTQFPLQFPCMAIQRMAGQQPMPSAIPPCTYWHLDFLDRIASILHLDSYDNIAGNARIRDQCQVQFSLKRRPYLQ